MKKQKNNQWKKLRPTEFKIEEKKVGKNQEDFIFSMLIISFIVGLCVSAMRGIISFSSSSIIFLLVYIIMVFIMRINSHKTIQEVYIKKKVKE